MSGSYPTPRMNGNLYLFNDDARLGFGSNACAPMGSYTAAPGSSAEMASYVTPLPANNHPASLEPTATPSSTPGDHRPIRASNAWILFRSQRCRERKANGQPESLTQGELSKLLASEWKSATLDYKRTFELQAEAKKAEHAAANPAGFHLRPVIMSQGKKAKAGTAAPKKKRRPRRPRQSISHEIQTISLEQRNDRPSSWYSAPSDKSTSPDLSGDYLEANFPLLPQDCELYPDQTRWQDFGAQYQGQIPVPLTLFPNLPLDAFYEQELPYSYSSSSSHSKSSSSTSFPQTSESSSLGKSAPIDMITPQQQPYTPPFIDEGLWLLQSTSFELPTHFDPREAFFHHQSLPNPSSLQPYLPPNSLPTRMRDPQIPCASQYPPPFASLNQPDLHRFG